MNAKTLSLLISAACTVAGLLSGLAPTRADAAPVSTASSAALRKAATLASGDAAVLPAGQSRTAQG